MASAVLIFLCLIICQTNGILEPFQKLGKINRNPNYDFHATTSGKGTYLIVGDPKHENFGFNSVTPNKGGYFVSHEPNIVNSLGLNENLPSHDHKANSHLSNLVNPPPSYDSNIMNSSYSRIDNQGNKWVPSPRSKSSSFYNNSRMNENMPIKTRSIINPQPYQLNPQLKRSANKKAEIRVQVKENVLDGKTGSSNRNDKVNPRIDSILHRKPIVIALESIKEILEGILQIFKTLIKDLE